MEWKSDPASVRSHKRKLITCKGWGTFLLSLWQDMAESALHRGIGNSAASLKMPAVASPEVAGPKHKDGHVFPPLPAGIYF